MYSMTAYDEVLKSRTASLLARLVLVFPTFFFIGCKSTINTSQVADAMTVTSSVSMVPGMWHGVRTGMPIATQHISESAYLVLSDDGQGRASFQLAMIAGDEVIQTLTAFQATTGLKSGKGVAVFNVEHIELDQFHAPTADHSANFVANTIVEAREGMMTCLFSTTTSGSPDQTPPPHCHAMVAGFDTLDPTQTYTGGYPAVGGHLGKAVVHVVLEMMIDSYPAIIEKQPGGALGGEVLSASDGQVAAAQQYLESHPNG